DFARLTRMPNLTDFAKVENDLSYVLLPWSEGAGRMQEARLGSETLEVDLKPLASTPAEHRHARLVEMLRRIAVRMDPPGGAAQPPPVHLLIPRGPGTAFVGDAGHIVVAGHASGIVLVARLAELGRRVLPHDRAVAGVLDVRVRVQDLPFRRRLELHLDAEAVEVGEVRQRAPAGRREVGRR